MKKMKKPIKNKENKDSTYLYLIESLKEIRDNWNGNTTKDFRLRKQIIEKALEQVKEKDDSSD